MAVAAMGQQEEEPDLETLLTRALEARSSYLRGQADTLTLPAVRRLLEEDLSLRTLYLDAYKPLIRGLVDKILNCGEDETIPVEKPRKRRKKNSRVVEDPCDGELETGRANNEKNDEKSKVPQDLPMEQEELSKASSLKLDNRNKSPDKHNERDVEKSENQGDSQVEPIEREVDQGVSPDTQSNIDKEMTEKDGGTQEVPPLTNGGELEGQGNKKKSEGQSGEEKLEGHINEEKSEGQVDEGNLGEQSTDVKSVEKTENGEQPSQPSKARNIVEDDIKAAFMKRADDMRSQSSSLTMKAVRRLLEEELGLESNALDGHRQFILTLIDELLEGPIEEVGLGSLKVKKSAEEKARGSAEGRLKKKVVVNAVVKKKEVYVESGEKLPVNGEVSGGESEEKTESKPRKKKNLEVKKKAMVVRKAPPEVKRPFGANVERLRETIKFIGLGISPAIYKKAKQAPEDERDDVLVQEFEAMLERVGLSSSSSDKEIRKVKNRLEKKRELDGIETDNIVKEPRRSRAATNSWFTPVVSKYSNIKQTSDRKDSEDQDSDDDAKPIVTGSMDD